MKLRKCLFCENDISSFKEDSFDTLKLSYNCSRCGYVCLTREAVDDFAGAIFSASDKKIISIVLRNEFERKGRAAVPRQLEIEDLRQIIKQYRRPDPLDMMDTALNNIGNASKFVGSKITITYDTDFPYYHCFNKEELESILAFLRMEGWITDFAGNGFKVMTKGYQRLRELKRSGKNSKQCFVAMWFTPEMDQVYKTAIKPAIEYTEEGEGQPRFEAVKIDNVEHVNDVNDEIIAQIRRSRFMVCDLTGYRGGVYFEAGFAYGLGLDVIYTCRKDWLKEEILQDNDKKQICKLFDSKGNEIQIKKEGVHFDLAHRNRIEWEADAPDDFKEKLKNRIKAVIY